MIFAIAPVERLELAVESVVAVRSSPSSLLPQPCVNRIFAIAPVERLELAVEGLVTVRSSPKSLRALALLCTLGRRRLHIRLHKLAHSLFAHGHTTCTRLNARHRLLLDLEGHPLLPLTRRLLDRHSRAPLLVLAAAPHALLLARHLLLKRRAVEAALVQPT